MNVQDADFEDLEGLLRAIVGAEDAVMQEVSAMTPRLTHLVYTEFVFVVGE